MDRHTAIEMYESLKTERMDTRREIDRLLKRESGLAKVLDGIEDLFPDLIENSDLAVIPPPTGGTSPNGRDAVPRGQDAVEQILVETSPRWLTIEEIADELNRRGWLPQSEDPTGAVRASVTRLYNASSELVRRKHGRAYRYRLTPELQTSEASDESEASDLLTTEGAAMPPP